MGSILLLNFNYNKPIQIMASLLDGENQFKLLQECSGHYLTEVFPDDWQDYSSDEREGFIASHKTESFEGMDVDDLMEEIDTMYRSMRRFISSLESKKGVKL